MRKNWVITVLCICLVFLVGWKITGRRTTQELRDSLERTEAKLSNVVRRSDEIAKQLERSKRRVAEIEESQRSAISRAEDAERSISFLAGGFSELGEGFGKLEGIINSGAELFETGDRLLKSGCPP